MKKNCIALFAALALWVCGSGIALAFPPASETIQGMDVSQYQGAVDYRRVPESGVRMVYIRSSLGYGYIDPYLERNADGARDAGLEFGFYHFCTASTREEAVRQARFFVEVTRRFDYDLKLVLELSPARELSRTETTDVALAFLEEVRLRTGSDGAVYCSASTARDKYDSRMARYALWVADYGVESPEPNNTWEFWSGFQYTDRGRVAGVRGRVDLDFFTAQMRVDRAPSPTAGPTASPLPTTTPSASPSCAPSASPAPSPTECPEIRLYVVQRGDTLCAIAQRFSVTVEFLAEANGIDDPSRLYPGQILRY